MIYQIDMSINNIDLYLTYTHYMINKRFSKESP